MVCRIGNGMYDTAYVCVQRIPPNGNGCSNFCCIQLFAARSLSLSLLLACYLTVRGTISMGEILYSEISHTYTRNTNLRFTFHNWLIYVFFLFVTNFLFVEDSGSEAKYMALFSTNSFITNEWIFGGV